MTPQFKKLNTIIGWLVWLVATFVYCRTIEPTASFWDCGEYIACSYKLEVGHPPGAPFFLLIGRFFALLGGGDPALAGMMINIMSALCSSFTILFLFWTITRLGIKTFGSKVTDLTNVQQWSVLAAGAVGGLAYTFSDSFWFSAVEGEVYAMSSFFTAIVFWAILKWDEEDSLNPGSALRWIVFINYLVGLSIGVHLLNLLVIPAIGFVIYFKKYKFSWKGFIIAGITSLFVLVFIQNLIIPKTVKMVSDFEVFFTNSAGLGYGKGTIIFFILLITSLTSFILYTVRKDEKFFKVGLISGIIFSLFAVITAAGGGGMFTRLIMLGGILYALHYYKSKTAILNTALMSLATLLIGFSSFFVLVIRSQANTPMDENNPENAPNMLSYLLREQYGDWPIAYGQYYNAPTEARSEWKSGDPIYVKDEKNKNYKVADSRKNSIPTYKSEFCTVFPRMWSSQNHHIAAYKYWGNVAENSKTSRTGVMETNENGEEVPAQIPTFGANIRYFVNYQVLYMYWRYFLWNFVGRQNDIQGMTNNTLEGNWISGIKAVDDFFTDSDTNLKTHMARHNFANNKYYAIPFILGILGIIFHVRRNKNDSWIVFTFFMLTGLAIVVYLNQTPYQPRERDYAYTGSFYAFAIWIGFGVLFLSEGFSTGWKFLASLGASARNGLAMYAAPLIGLAAPALMAAEGWNDHDRSLRTLSRDSAINYLQSCEPNAILFTNGDNDTFPLWYAQEVEGIRTDVRVVNLSLLQTDWYIDQMRRAAYDSKPVPFTIPADKYAQDKLNVVYLTPKDEVRNVNYGNMNLKKAFQFLLSEDPNNKIDAGDGNLIDYFPSKQFYIPVDSAKVVNKKIVSLKDTARLAKSITWKLNKSALFKNDLMVLDLVAHNDWSRPIYFAVTTGNEAYVGLEEYFQLEGLAYRLVPIRQTENERAQGGRVNTEVMYKNVMEKFRYGGMNKPGVNLDENCVRMAGNMRMQMSILAGALINEGKNSKAKAVLDKCLEEMPDETVPYDATLFTICAEYFQINETKKGAELAKKLFDIQLNDLKVYNSQKARHRVAFGREISQCQDIMRRLYTLAVQFKQKDLEAQFLKGLQENVSPEDLMPEQPQGQPAQTIEN